MHRTSLSALAATVALGALVGCDDRSVPTGARPDKPSLSVYNVAVSGPVVLNALSGSNYAIAYGINAGGDAVGVSTDPTVMAPAKTFAVLWPSGTTTPSVIDGPGAIARDVNALRQVAGQYGSGAALWTLNAGAYTRTDIGMQIVIATGATSSEALGINDFGEVVGWLFLPSNIAKCFLWRPAVSNGTTGTLAILPSLGGSQCFATDINSTGQVAGGSSLSVAAPDVRHAFVFTPTVPNGLAGSIADVTPSAESDGLAINDAAEVGGLVGPLSLPYDVAIFGQVGPASWLTLDLGIPPLVGLVSPNGGAANDINDAGYVVGYARDVSLNFGAFFWQNGIYTQLPGPPNQRVEATAMTDVSNSAVTVVGGSVVPAPEAFTALRWELTLTPVQYQLELQQLAAAVKDYYTRGVLNAGEQRSLLGKVDAAARQIAQQQPQAAINVLGAFTNEVNGLVTARRLTSELAQPLLDHARLAISALQTPRA